MENTVKIAQVREFDLITGLPCIEVRKKDNKPARRFVVLYHINENNPTSTQTCPRVAFIDTHVEVNGKTELRAGVKDLAYYKRLVGKSFNGEFCQENVESHDLGGNKVTKHTMCIYKGEDKYAIFKAAGRPIVDTAPIAEAVATVGAEEISA